MDGIVPRSWAPWLLSLLRIVAGFLFLFHGAQKLLAWPTGVGPGNTTVPLMSLMGLAGIIELFGGSLICVGLFTRLVAFIASGEMAVAYFRAHAPRGPWPLVNMGELAVLYCILFLYLAAAGPGPWSLDAMRRGGNR
jgi:putative oxidoreductase